MQNNVQISGKWSKSKPKVDFQYGGRLFFKNGSSYISAINWDMATKFGLLTDFDLLKAAISTDAKPETGIGSGETLCYDTYPARPITTVSVATNTYCMMYGHSSCAPRTVGRRVQFSGACEQSHWWPARHTAGGHLLSEVQAATKTERL